MEKTQDWAYTIIPWIKTQTYGRGHPDLNRGPLDLQSNALPLSYAPSMLELFYKCLNLHSHTQHYYDLYFLLGKTSTAASTNSSQTGPSPVPGIFNFVPCCNVSTLPYTSEPMGAAQLETGGHKLLQRTSDLHVWFLQLYTSPQSVETLPNFSGEPCGTCMWRQLHSPWMIYVLALRVAPGEMVKMSLQAWVGHPGDLTAEQEDRGSGDDEAVDPTLSFRSVTTTQTHCHEF